MANLRQQSALDVPEFMSDKPKYAEHIGHALKPPLEQTYFVKVPRSQRYMVKGSVTMSCAMRVVSRRQAVTGARRSTSARCACTATGYTR